MKDYQFMSASRALSARSVQEIVIGAKRRSRTMQRN